MSSVMLLSLAAILTATQGLLGTLAFLGRGAPLLMLPLAVVQVWMVVRVAQVLREELIRHAKKGHPQPALPVGLLTALVWQAPAWMAHPFWAPEWLTWLWQGTLLTSLRIFGLELSAPWLWLASLAEVALFVAVVRRPEPGRYMPKPLTVEQRSAGSGEWATARTAPEGSRAAAKSRPTRDVAAARQHSEDE